MNDGRKLENLVAFIEKTFLPEGFEVVCNERVYDNDGNQIAELDIQIRGKLGTTQIAWLIECRDRPSAGSAPISWIEELVARRDRLNFSKVTAVSTSGFSPAAIKYAKEKAVDLRVINSVTPEEFDWIIGNYILD